jgi:uncharacterized protein (TIGR02001 family)
MRKAGLTYILASALASSALLDVPAQAGVTGNVRLSSNYIWRGVTQTSDQAAISGGLDYSSDIGFYAGTWLSNVDFGDAGGSGYELDLYGGYSGQIQAFSYDAGLLYYAYPVQDDLNFTELYVSGGVGPLKVGVNYTVDKDAGGDDKDIYYYGELGFEDLFKGESLKDIGVSFVVGHYDYDDNALDDYTHYGFKLSKATDLGDFGIAVDKNDLDGGHLDDPRVTVSLSKEFDF